MKSALAFLYLSCLGLALGGPSAQAQNSPPATDDGRLAALRALKIDGGTITSMERLVTPTLEIPNRRPLINLPPRIVVKVILHPAPGSNINVELWLPDTEKWNSRFLGLGNGGAAGRINPGIFSAVSAGYAVATTDMGTAPNPDSGVGNPEVWKDFGFRATHLMTVVSRQMMQAYYGRLPEYAYFNGGSTGGQQALQEAQRYPEDYDGIAAAIPAHCRTPLHAYFLWNDQILKACPFTKAQEANVVAAGIEYMAAREIPPVAGKFVSDPRVRAGDIAAVIALARKKDPTLTDQQAEALRKLFDGPRHAVTGERIFDGIPFGASFEGSHDALYLFKWVFGAKKNLADIDFGADIDTYTAALGPYLNAENPDLSRFEKRGAKLLVTVGTADPIVPYPATLDYYERVIEHFGSLAAVQSFFRLYLIPGMSHGGGPGINHPPDGLGAVIAWREKGIVPGALMGSRVVDGKTVLEMPLYPYPQKTGWDAAAARYQPIDGPRGGVERVDERFRPPAAE